MRPRARRKGFSAVNKSKLIAYALGGWLLVEALAFVLVVHFMGITAALALGLGTTLLGLFDVKRLLDYLRNRAGFKSPEKSGAKPDLVDSGLQALCSALLILPGFASDLVGLALKAPSIRAGLGKRLRGDVERRGPQTIDLKPTEWKSLDRPRRRRRVTAKPSSAPPTA
jgi:UPF0716 protein FxsA